MTATICNARIGPVPKLWGEVFVCTLPRLHAGDHWNDDCAWWVDPGRDFECVL